MDESRSDVGRSFHRLARIISRNKEVMIRVGVSKGIAKFKFGTTGGS